MKKWIAVLLCVMMAMASLTALAEDSDKAAIVAKGKLTVGITEFKPMDYRDEAGEWIGFDADLARAFAASLGVEAEFVEIEWDNKILELDSGNIDCVWNGMTLTAEVTSAMDCSKAYANNAQIVVVPKDKVADITEESLAALTFAVEAGSAADALLKEKGYTVNAVQSQAAALMEVAGMTSDAAVIDSLMAAAMVGEGTDYPDLTYTLPLNSEEYGVGFRKGSDLTDALNEYLAAAWKDGSLMAIAEQYKVQAAMIPQE